MKRSLLILLLAALLLSACVHTPPEPTPVDTAPDGSSALPNDSTPVSVDDTSDTTAIDEPSPGEEPVSVENFRITEDDGTVTIKTVSIPADRFTVLSPASTVMLDETHLLLILWDETEAGEVENLRFTFADLTTGKLTGAEYPLGGSIVPQNAYRGIDGSLYLKAYGREDADDAAWEITGEWYDPTVEPLTAEDAGKLDLNNHTSVVESEDGSWIAWHRNSAEDRSQSGLWIRDAAGGTRHIKTNVTLDDVPEDHDGQAIGAVRGYSPVGFIDETTLVYRIGGWEWMWGYGYYDAVTKEIREVENGRTVLAVGNGFLYTAEVGNYSYDAVYKEYPDGTEELLTSQETNEMEALAPFFTTDMLVGLNYTDSLCSLLYPVDTSYPAETDTLQLTVLDADLTTVHLSAYVEPEAKTHPFWTWCGDTLVLFRAEGASGK